VRDKIYCQTCRKYVRFLDGAMNVYLAEHPCCECPNCEGQCKDSGTVIHSLSRIPSWHPQHICGIFCDGQDGASSQCARDKRKGPPDAVERLADITP
jgi:hypothetical protein